MFYIGILILMIFMVSMDEKYSKYKEKIFCITALTLIFITAIRYGSGIDYFAYLWHYNNNTPINLINALMLDTNIDIGFRGVSSIFKILKLNFGIFIIFITLITLGMYIYTINKYSLKKVLSLFVLFAFYHEVYITSALRQGLAMSIFFMAFYKYLSKSEYKKYIFAIIVASLFHKSILVTLPLIIIHKYREYLINNKKLNISLIIIVVCAAIIKIDTLFIIIGQILKIDKLMYYTPSGISISALILRLGMLSIVYILYIISDKNKIDEFDRFQIYTYFIGIIAYIAISNNSIYSRLTDIFMILDIILIPNLIARTYLYSKVNLIILIILLIGSVLYLKDIKSSLHNGSYYDKSIFKYPYVTIFDKEKLNKMKKYRDIPYNNIDF